MVRRKGEKRKGNKVEYGKGIKEGKRTSNGGGVEETAGVY